MHFNQLKNNALTNKKISVDGSCIKSGMCYYRGVDMATGEELFFADIGLATNNIAEFLAICHAVYYCEQNFINATIYSDSLTAISWIRKNQVRTVNDDAGVLKRVANALKFIKGKNINVCKWDTRNLGEIPADFGNKKKGAKKRIKAESFSIKNPRDTELQKRYDKFKVKN